MTKITLDIYDFNRPRLLNEGEFKLFKQIYNTKPGISLIPESNFWLEFPEIKWSGIAVICSIPFIFISEKFSFMLGISIIMLTTASLPNLKSMINFSSMNNKRRRVYNKLEDIIINSYDYSEFVYNFRKNM